MAQQQGGGPEAPRLRRGTRGSAPSAGGMVLKGPFEIQIGLCAVVADPWDNVLVILDTSKGTLRVDKNKRVIDDPAT